MFLEQICPGQVNSNPHAIHTFVYQNDRFIIYATGSKVVIFADPDNLVQIVSAPPFFQDNDNKLEPVTAVTGSNKTGKIAFSYRNHVAILKHVEGQTQWELESRIETKHPVTCLDWSTDGSLLGAGEEIYLWKPSSDINVWELAWSTRPAADVYLAKFEPDSTRFATVGKFDRLVAIWYPNPLASITLDYNFAFLSHPKYVTHFTWRKLISNPAPNDCTLFTMARDGIGRFWSPTDLERPHMLYLCAVIDSNQSLVTSNEPDDSNSNNNHSCSSSGNSMVDYDQISSDFSPIHYIGCDELHSAIYSQFRSHSKHERFDQRLDRIRDLVRDTPDLLFRIQSDGSLTFWGIQHLNTLPRRIPRVFVVLRVEKAIDPMDVIYFLNPAHILHDYAHIQSSSVIKPIELSLVAHNSHGQLRCYSLNLVDFLDTTNFVPRLHLKYTWLGHQHSISSLYQTQKNRFCTIGVGGQINVWKYELRETCGRMTTQLQLDSALHVNSSLILSVPVGKDRYMAVYEGETLQIYEFDRDDCHLHRHQQCPSFDQNSAKLSFLHVYNLQDTDEIRSHLLIGVSAKSISTWYLEQDTTSHTLDIQFRGTVEMEWAQPPSLVVSSSQWATNTSSKLFHRLASKDQNVLVAVLGSVIYFYGFEGSEKIEWKCLFSVETELENISQVRCTPGTIAIVSGQEKPCQLSIWMEMRPGFPPTMVKSFSFNERICDLAWNVSSDAQFILAVAFPRSVAIFGQKRATSVLNDNDIWVCYTEFKVDTAEDISALAWVDCGVLTVASGNQIRCYLKWLTQEDKLGQLEVPLNNELEPMSSIFDISYTMNGPLPFYHPNHLIHYIMWDKMDLVNNILVSLYAFLRQFIDEENTDVIEFPPVSFPKILLLQNAKSKSQTQKQSYSALFDDDDDTEENLVMNDDDGAVRPLTENEAKNLSHILKSKSLPGLNENDRMHLVAMVNTIVEINSEGASLDENGARFTVIAENYFHLLKVLPDKKKISLQAKDYVWALHSQSQDLLLERCVRLCGDRFLWEEARNLGIFLWLQKIDVVRDQMGIIARNIYLSKTDFRDPIDCSLFYIALRKKNLLQGLWRTAPHHNEQAAMIKFLANDFTEQRWKTAATKNAFALLGKQRFEYAAAFFLLADKLKDACNVIIKNVNDYQLAIAICRVYDGDHSPLLKDLLENTVIPTAIENNDRWLVSLAFSLLENQKDSIRSMVVPLTQFNKNGEMSVSDSASNVYEPNLFILYHYLKKQLKQNSQLDMPYAVEYRFNLLVSRSYERLGCPLLALYILTRYYMKPPSLEENKEKEESKLDRAEDLFADEPAKPSYATDLFSDEPAKPSYADDLFADEPAKSFYATDLFADEPPSKPSYATDLFADEEPTSSNDLFANDDDDDDDDDDDIFASKPASSSQGLFDDADNGDDDDETSTETPDEKVYDGLDAYKALLVIRILQTFFHAASSLYHTSQIHDDAYEARYRSHFIRNRQSLIKLGESVKIPPHIFSRLLMEKSIETDVFPLYLYILNEGIPKDFDVHQFLRAFKVGCFEVNEVALMPQELDYSTLVFIENWTDHVMKTFPIWNSLRMRYCNPETVVLTTKQIALTTYISSILVTLKERQYEKSWGLIFRFKMFLEALGTANSETALQTITNCINQLYEGETKMVEMAPEDFESFSDGSMFGFDMEEEVYRPLLDSQDKSVGANLLEAASLNYILSAIEYAMQFHGKHHLGEQLTDFIWTTLLDPIAYRAYCLRDEISRQLDQDLGRHNVMSQYNTLRQKRYWHSIKSLSSAERLLPFANFTVSSVNILGDDQAHVRNIYNSASTAYAFCINSNNADIMAICLKSEVQEVDISKGGNGFGTPLLRSRSVSSTGFVHDHLDSYPDTEEDEDDFSSDNENDTVTPLKGARRKLPINSSTKASGSSTPIMSPASGRTFDEQKTTNVNLEHLHDSLRRSLAMGSDISRTPTASSPLGGGDNVDREKMIMLSRGVSATCADAHPQYPFYITGYEVTNGGPSAVLWQFGQEREIASYYGIQGKATRIHFDHFGQKFGAGDTTGLLCLWRFDSHVHSNKPYYTVQCHSKATRDFTFLNSSSLVATAGTSLTMSRKRDHVCLWDTLLPPSKALICSLPGHESGAYAITYDPNSQLLFSGGKKGEVVVSDIRQRTTMHNFIAHQSRIRSIAIDTENNALITGSIDGELKIWDANTYKLRQNFDIQPRNRFLVPSFNRIPLKAFGVTQVQVFNEIYTSGPNGIVKCAF